MPSSENDGATTLQFVRLACRSTFAKLCTFLTPSHWLTTCGDVMYINLSELFRNGTFCHHALFTFTHGALDLYIALLQYCKSSPKFCRLLSLQVVSVHAQQLRGKTLRVKVCVSLVYSSIIQLLVNLSWYHAVSHIVPHVQ